MAKVIDNKLGANSFNSYDKGYKLRSDKSKSI